jgi:Lrp/AsnC family transcriptional regulator
VDKLDLRILDALQSHAESTSSELAERVGLSATPIWRRIKKLEADGYITGKVVLLNPKALGLTVNVFAEVRLQQHDEQTLLALEAAVRDQPEIVECFSVSGEADYLLRVVTTSIEAYEAFLKKGLLHLPGIASVNSRFALGCVKLTTKLPIAAN